jgi:hypothetical protein
VSFNPDVTVAVVVPVSRDPTGVGVRWFDVGSGDPDVMVAIPTVVAFVPCPIGVFVGGWWNALLRAWRGTDADYDLGLGDACGEKEDAGGNGEKVLHRDDLLILLTVGRLFRPTSWLLEIAGSSL